MPIRRTMFVPPPPSPPCTIDAYINRWNVYIYSYNTVYIRIYIICIHSANRFEYASTMVPQGDGQLTKGKDYSRGNSYWYGVRGCDLKCGRRRKVTVGDVRGLMSILATHPLVSCESLRPPVVRTGQPKATTGVGSPSEQRQNVCSEGGGAMRSDEKVVTPSVSASETQTVDTCQEHIEEDKHTHTDPCAPRSHDSSLSNATDVVRQSSSQRDASCNDTRAEPAQEKKGAHVPFFECRQEIVELSKLIVFVTFNVPISSVGDVELDVSSSNRSLRIAYGDNTAAIALVSVIQPESIKAKFNKKKDQLTIHATIK